MVKNSVRDSIKLSSVDDLFSTEESRADEKREKVMDIPLSEISDFPNHPFKVKANEAMLEMADSVKQYGVLVPGLVRPNPGGGYEMVAGHRRKKASELAGIETFFYSEQQRKRNAAFIPDSAELSGTPILRPCPSNKAGKYPPLHSVKKQACCAIFISA